MPPKRRTARQRRPEHLTRRIEITAVNVGVQLGVQTERGADPELHNYGQIELVGLMDEAVRSTRDVHIVVYSTDDRRVGPGPPPCIGYIHGITPVVQPALFIPQEDFNRVMTLALSGQLKHAFMVMTPPRYHTALVTSLSFSTHLEE